MSIRRSLGGSGEDQLDSTGSSCSLSVADILDGESEYDDIASDFEARDEDEDEDGTPEAGLVDQGTSLLQPR